jgi:hypothetical protein
VHRLAGKVAETSGFELELDEAAEVGVNALFGVRAFG